MGPAVTRGRQAAEGIADRRGLSALGFPRSSPLFDAPARQGCARPGRGQRQVRYGVKLGNPERGFGMVGLYRSLVSFLQREDGPTAVEYAVMLALIVVVCIAAITTLGSNSKTTFNSVATTVASTTGS